MVIYIVTEESEISKESQKIKAFRDIDKAKDYALERANSYGLKYWNANVGELPCYIESSFDRFVIEVISTTLVD